MQEVAQALDDLERVIFPNGRETNKPVHQLTENEFYEFIGKRIRAFRKKAQLSQTDLANDIEVSFQTIQKYECGYCKIPIYRLQIIAEVFNKTVADFLPGA